MCDTKIYFWNRVVFRGSREDKAVLCTDDKTFEVKEAETSNSLLLLPTLKLAEECEGSSENRPLEEKEVGFVSYQLFLITYFIHSKLEYTVGLTDNVIGAKQ